jgi:hypothetical protein
MNREEDEDPYSIELFGNDFESTVSESRRKRKRNNDTVFKKMLQNITDPGLPDEYDTFNAEMEQLYKTLERNDNAKNLTEIIKELTERINEKIENEKVLIEKSKEQGYSNTEYIQKTINRYQKNLNKLNKLEDIQKFDILEIYNNPNIPIDDKRNAINGIINGDIVITAKSREINSMHTSMPISMAMANSVTNKQKKKGGKKSYKKKSTKKSRTKKARK